MERHFVNFLSPGSFVSEQTARPIDAWDAETAILMAEGITERHGATPYGFYFTTRSRGPDDLDSKETAKGPVHYLGGLIETVEEVEARADPKERILLDNMRCNKWALIVTNANSYRFTQPLRAGDVVLNATGSADALARYQAGRATP